MKIVMLGAGNVATHLSIVLQKADVTISQVYSRTEEAAEKLAKELNTSFTNDISAIQTDADIYIYCLKDSVLEAFISKINVPKAIHIHTSGSTDISVFEPYYKKYGVLYPLQTFSNNKAVNFTEVPVFIEANSQEVEKKIIQLAKLLSPKVYSISSKQRSELHLAAVFACNFTNYFYTLSSEIVEKAGLPFEILIPLITETADKIKYLSPLDAQTGPAVRMDENIISKHLTLLAENQDKKLIYEELSKQIYQKYQKEK
ncbi:MAG: DUF2520 domain-containing protein [Paludibacter sp.]|nr:DUF2520 domain-containing protein [Paludibacter sp.]